MLLLSSLLSFLLPGVSVDVERILTWIGADNKHRQEIIFGEKLRPLVAQDAFIAPCATLAGMVEVWHHSSIWYRVTIKGAPLFMLGERELIKVA